MLRAYPILFAVGCGVETSAPPDLTTIPQLTFMHDTYYTGVVPPYATPEDCEASDPSPIRCHLELGFCAGGVAGFSNFDLPQRGEYHLEGQIVVATVSNPGGPDAVIRLDTRTGQATNAEVDSYLLDTVGRWDTLQFDTGTTCPDEHTSMP
jgi:hypothetical protein